MLEVGNDPIVKTIFSTWKHDMIMDAIENGNSLASIWVDQRDNPNCAVIIKDFRIRVAGFPKKFNQLKQLVQFFRGVILQNKITGCQNEMFLSWQESEWQPFLMALFHDYQTLIIPRAYYELALEDLNIDVAPSTSKIIPMQELLSLSHKYLNVDYLKRDWQVKFKSRDDFLTHGFGFCVLENNMIVGWCLSENEHPKGCEMEVVVHPDFRQIETLQPLVNHFLREAKRRKLSKVGWSLYQGNFVSRELAQMFQFELMKEYDSLHVNWFKSKKKESL